MVDNCVWLSLGLLLGLEHNAHCLIFRGSRAGIEGLWRTLEEILTSLTAELGQYKLKKKKTEMEKGIRLLAFVLKVVQTGERGREQISILMCGVILGKSL